MKMRFYLSLFIAKFLYLILKITKLSSGTAILGLITLKICPNFLTLANDYIGNTKINITGTNGKTTTSGIITHLIKKTNAKIINNTSGANMLNGIVNALALQINPFKKADFSVIETDEAFLEKVYSKIRGDYLLVTNLFEDQTDRFANPLITKDIIQKGINKSPDVQLILNANEPISASLESSKPNIYYAVKSVIDESGNSICNVSAEQVCPKCGKNLCYEKVFYSHIGEFSCNCGFRTNNAKYLADVILYKTHSQIKINEEVYDVPLVGLYNAYNALGAIVLAKELGIKNIRENLKSYKVAFGRGEKKLLKGLETTIQLIKNPAGANEVLKSIDLNSNIMIVINNNIADGTDISWINQVDFEKLSQSSNEIIASGLCAKEIAERLRKAGIEKIKVIDNIDLAVKYLGEISKDKITILTTYTALLKINKIKEIKKCY